jgi:hypothetical protein
MIEVIERRGRFALVHCDAGFCWIMDGPDGKRWYWHPLETHWTACPVNWASRELASARIVFDAMPAAGQYRRPEESQPTDSDRGTSPGKVPNPDADPFASGGEGRQEGRAVPATKA